MTMTNKQAVLFFFILFSSAWLFSSCGSGKDCVVENFNTDINAAVDNLNAAISTYNRDPSNANCENMQKAANEYLDEVEAYSDCAETFGQAQFDQALVAARDAVNATSSCN